MIATIFFLCSCLNTSTTDLTPSKISNDSVQYYYVEYIGPESTVYSDSLVKIIKQKLFSKVYWLGNTPNEMQGIQSTDFKSPIDPSLIDPHYPQRHVFIDYVEYTDSDPAAIKIEFAFPLGDEDDIVIHFFNNRGHKEWQSLLNPGGFNLNEGDQTTAEFAESLADLIILCSFK
jgi:hypothetical protein